MKTKIRKPNISDASKICSMVNSVFMKCVAPDYSEEGIDFFLKISTPAELIDKMEKGNLVYIAEMKSNIIGVIVTRNINHISRYFVDVNYQQMGIGRKLFQHVLSTLSKEHQEIEQITVNSSPFAVKAYEKLGFIKTADEQIGNGMKYIPMVYNIESELF
jgi:predicted GNAT family N-acyltransferase